MTDSLENNGVKKDGLETPIAEALGTTPNEDAQPLEHSFLDGWRFCGTIVG